MKILSVLFVVLFLAGCRTTGSAVSFNLAATPTELERCFNQLTGFPKTKNLSEAQAIKLIAKLRKSEVSKSLCGKRLLKWIDGQREVIKEVNKKLK